MSALVVPSCQRQWGYKGMIQPLFTDDPEEMQPCFHMQDEFSSWMLVDEENDIFIFKVSTFGLQSPKDIEQ